VKARTVKHKLQTRSFPESGFRTKPWEIVKYVSQGMISSIKKQSLVVQVTSLHSPQKR